jgi:kynurenine formamidase
MKTRTLVIGYALALAMFLFAQRHTTPAQGHAFNTVVDLTHHARQAEPQLHAVAFNGSATRNGTFATYMEAPARFARGLWTVDEIPGERLRAPLVVLDVSSKAEQNFDYRVSVDDIADWEKSNGQVPQGAVVVARTGWESRWPSASQYRNSDARNINHFPAYSEEAARFLVDGRNVIALGIDTPSVNPGSDKNAYVRNYTLAHSLYHLENLANLSQVPVAGATVVVAPTKLAGASSAPVRVLAMMK